ncbi:MAG: hypothetical protein Q4G05_02305 [Clostridia bacterium]|nr:hypothetical protein [Clostridia bacterium]
MAKNNFEGNKEDVLLAKIEKSFSNYLSFFRFPNDFNFNQEYIKEILTKTVSTVTDLVEKNIKLKQDESILDLESSGLSQEKAAKIDNILNDPPTSKVSLNKKDIDIAIDCLIREPVSKQLSRKYLDNYILTNTNTNTSLIQPPSNQFVKLFNDIKNKFNNLFKSNLEKMSPSQYNSLFFSTTFMKLSNTEMGHSGTDESLRSIPEEIKNELSEYIDFNDDLSNIKNDNLFIDVGGGNFLVLYDKNITLENDKLKSVISNVNEKQPMLKISGTRSTEPISCSEITSFIQKADNSNELKFDKLELKKDKFLGKDSQHALDLALEDCIQYYIETNPETYNSIESKQQFLNLMARGVLNSASNEFSKQQEFHKEKSKDRELEKEFKQTSTQDKKEQKYYENEDR